MFKQRLSRGATTAAVLLLIGAAGAGSGVAYALVANAPDLPPAGVSTEPDGVPAPRIVPDYPMNALGLTYGSVEEANSPQDEPDLILVTTQNGTRGYVLKTELDAATGASVSSPEEAIAWEAKTDALVASGQRILVPVYSEDGFKVQGQFFEVTPSLPDAAP